MTDKKVEDDLKKLREYLDEHFPVLTEEDFYPPADERIRSCGVDDIPGGDNYVDYFNWFYETYGEDVFC